MAPSLRFAYVVEVTNRLLFPERYSRRAWLPSPQHATPILQAPAASALPFFLQLEVPSFPVSLPCLPPERAAVGRLVPRGSLLMGPCVPEMVLPTTSLHSPATSGGEMAHAAFRHTQLGQSHRKMGFTITLITVFTHHFLFREKKEKSTQSSYLWKVLFPTVIEIGIPAHPSGKINQNKDLGHAQRRWLGVRVLWSRPGALAARGCRAVKGGRVEEAGTEGSLLGKADRAHPRNPGEEGGSH